jgi:transposase
MVTIRNTAVPREEGWRAFRQVHDARRRERYHCMLRLIDGKSCPGIAQWLYREEDTIRSWVHAFNQGGLQGLEREGIPGRPAWLTTEQRTQAKEAVRRCPRELGYHMSLWTTKLVRHFTATRLGVEDCRGRVRQLLHAPGFLLRRLRHHHLKGKPEEQAVSRAELEELLREWSEDWELVFVDEATVRRHPTPTAQWSGQTHYHLSPELSQAEFAPFLRRLLA